MISLFHSVVSYLPPYYQFLVLKLKPNAAGVADKRRRAVSGGDPAQAACGPAEEAGTGPGRTGDRAPGARDPPDDQPAAAGGETRPEEEARQDQTQQAQAQQQAHQYPSRCVCWTWCPCTQNLLVWNYPNGCRL